jgi:hypothetical protein
MSKLLTMAPQSAALVAFTALVVALTAEGVAAQELANYRLTPGWATFGLTLPKGAATGAVRVGKLETQTNVKTTWPDGSLRFAVVTAKVPEADSYAITADSTPRGAAMRGAWPNASVEFVINGQTWVAAFPASPSDAWLSGPLVTEARAVVAPVAGTVAHPGLDVIFDVRLYADGEYVVDVTVENVTDAAAGNQIVYDVAIGVGGERAFSKSAVQHTYLSRWRHVTSKAHRSTIREDFRSAQAAGALPEYLSTLRAPEASIKRPGFDILQRGDLHNPMNDHGNRPEIALLPDWAAQYVALQRPDLKTYVLRHGDLAGSWPIHLREPDGRLISIDERPGFWLDCRSGAHGPRSCAGKPYVPGRGDLVPDIAHQPSLAYVPYLVTGDRYYLDEMKFWANYCLIGTYQDPSDLKISRGGSLGLLDPNEIRGVAWALRNIAQATAYLPDTDPTRPYFRQKLQTNLDFYEKYATTFQTPLGTLFTGMRPEDRERPPFAFIALWEHVYLAWAIDHALNLGFSPGAALRDRVARLHLRLLTSEAEGYPRKYGAPYLLIVGTKTPDGRYEYFRTLRELFAATYGDPPGAPVPINTVGPEARMMLIIAMKLGLPGAAEAIDYLMAQSYAGVPFATELARRAGWAVAPPAGDRRTAPGAGK